jgi:hypothetical protein
MDDRKTIDINEWQYSRSLIIAKPRKSKRFWSPTAIGILGTLVLHAALIPSVYQGSRSTNIKPPEVQRPGRSAVKSKAEIIASLVFIDMPRLVTPTPVSSANLPSKRTLIKTELQISPPTLANVEILALTEDQSSVKEEANGDSSEEGRLFGIYTGQIRARIERVWRRPRSPINSASDESFQCQVQIVQDIRGNVVEILLPNCNGSQAWQRSLVMAIQQASPLPAPPSASIYSGSVSLSFIEIPFRAGSSEDEYELPPRSLARAELSGNR